MTALTDERYISVREAANYLGVSNNTVVSWLHDHSIEHMRVGRENAAKQTYLIWYPAFKRFIEEHTYGRDHHRNVETGRRCRTIGLRSEKLHVR